MNIERNTVSCSRNHLGSAEPAASVGERPYEQTQRRNESEHESGTHEVAVVLHELVERMRRVVQYDRDRSPPRLRKAHNLKTRPCPLAHSLSLLRRAGLRLGPLTVRARTLAHAGAARRFIPAAYNVRQQWRGGRMRG